MLYEKIKNARTTASHLLRCAFRAFVLLPPALYPCIALCLYTATVPSGSRILLFTSHCCLFVFFCCLFFFFCYLFQWPFLVKVEYKTLKILIFFLFPAASSLQQKLLILFLLIGKKCRCQNFSEELHHGMLCWTAAPCWDFNSKRVVIFSGIEKARKWWTKTLLLIILLGFGHRLWPMERVQLSKASSVT